MFFKEEVLEDECFCKHCKILMKAKRSLSLHKLPKVLILHLKRFQVGKYRNEKITLPIKFPTDTLDLEPFINLSTEVPSASHLS